MDGKIHSPPACAPSTFGGLIPTPRWPSGILMLKNFASYATRCREGETFGSNISDGRGFLFDVVHLLE